MAQNDSYGSEPQTGSSLAPRRQNGNQLPFASAPVSTVNSSTSSPTPQHKKKRRRRVKGGAAMQEIAPAPTLANDANTSPSFQPSSPATSPRDQHTSDGSFPQQNAMPESQSSFGNNRLAGGFAREQSFPDLTPSDSRAPSLAKGSSQQNAIELSDSGSDDEIDHSDGGMAVNLVSSDESESDHWIDEEINRLGGDQRARPGTKADARDSVSGTLRLADLNPDDLKDQIRYALYHLQRHQIDLSRPVTCLACLHEGHMANTCLETHSTVCGEASSHSSRVFSDRGSHNNPASSHCFFPPYQPDRGTPVQLWISCCICASKSHLVGDCPDLDENAAAERWSLKALDPTQITNLSLQTGTRDREREAESRGLRPPGLHIRGRADLHHAGAARAGIAPDDDDEPFLKPPVAARRDFSRPQVKLGQYRPQRSSTAGDRFDSRAPPSNDRSYSSSGRDNWYATDSFGKRRSRSPGEVAAPASPFGDSWRPEHHSGGGRPFSTRRFDAYRQDRSSLSSDFARRKPNNPPTSNGQAVPGRNQVKMQLPTRKGSKPNLATPAEQTTNTKKTDASAAAESNSDNIGGGGGGGGGGGAGQRKKGKPVKSTSAN